MTQLAPYPADFRIGDDPAKGVYLGDTKIWWQVRPGRADFFSDGALAASAMQLGMAEPYPSGAGALSATAKPRYVRTASFSGGSALAAISAPKRAISVGFSGAAALAATAHPWSPSDIPGLAAWIDPTQDQAAVTYGSDERAMVDWPPVYTYQGDYTLGLRFTPTVGGRITHLLCYLEGGTHKFSLWDATTGTKLTSVTDTSTGPRAWRQVALPIPFNVEAGKSYMATASVDWLGYGYSPMPVGSQAPHLTSLAPFYGVGSDVFPNVDGAGNHDHVDVIFQPVTSGYAEGTALASYTSYDPTGRVFTSPSTNKPIFRSAAVGGRPRIQFDYTKAIQFFSDNYNPGTAGLTYVFIGQTDIFTSYGMMLVWSSDHNYEIRNVNGDVQVVGDYQSGGPAVSSAFARSINVDYVMLMRADMSETKIRLYINDTEQFAVNSVAAMPNVARTITVGHRFPDGYYWHGMLAEALVFSGPISAADRAKLMGYLRAKHGQAFPAMGP